MTVTWVNIVRVVTIANGLASMVLSALSLHHFARRAPPTRIRSHVRRVTVTYLGFVCYGLVEVITHWGHEMRWQLAALFVVFSLALHAQVPLLNYERSSAARVVLRGRRVGD